MRWLWFVASLICFAIVFKTASIGLATLGLLGALVFLLIGTVALASSRIGNRSRDATTLLGPDELRRVREIEAKRRGGGAPTDTSASMFAGGVLLSNPSPAHARHGDHAARSNDLDAGHDVAGSDGGGDGGGSD